MRHDTIFCFATSVSRTAQVELNSATSAKFLHLTLLRVLTRDIETRKLKSNVRLLLLNHAQLGSGCLIMLIAFHNLNAFLGQ